MTEANISKTRFNIKFDLSKLMLQFLHRNSEHNRYITHVSIKPTPMAF